MAGCCRRRAVRALLIHVSELSGRPRDNGSMSWSRRHFVLASAASLAMLAATQARADRRGLEQDDLRRAVESGEARPLADIIAETRNKLPGEIVGVKIEKKEQSRWVYEFRVIDRSGRLFEVHVDARSGAVERIREK
jgi:uncharacterized membrane protein YkoI